MLGDQVLFLLTVVGGPAVSIYTVQRRLGGNEALQPVGSSLLPGFPSSPKV